MQRFRMVGYYLAGVAVIFALAVWGVSLRSNEADEATTPQVAPAAPAANQELQARSIESAPLPAAVRAEMHAAVKVSITDFHFVPDELTIPAGTMVTWTNTDDVPHTASSLSKPSVFDSKMLDTNETFSFQFRMPGTYEYCCKAHPRMTGKIIVK